MIEYALVFTLGALLAGLVWLILLPAFWRRAVRITTDRLEQQLPISPEDIFAARDRIRAAHAVAMARIEQEAKQTRAALAAAKAEIGERLKAESALHDALAAERRRVAAFETDLAALRVEAEASAARLADLAAQRDEARATIAALEGQRETLASRLDAAIDLAESRRLALDEARLQAERAREAHQEEARRAALLRQIMEEAYAELNKPMPVRRDRTLNGAKTVRPAPHIPTPPFWGTKTIYDMPLEIVLKYLHKAELYRLSWGATNTHGEAWTKLEAEYDARLDRMTRAALKDRTLRPQAVYGYFPAQSSGDDLIIYDPAPLAASGRADMRAEGRDLVEIARFTFPRQPYGDHLCISDYYAGVDSGLIDVCPLQIVTVGEAATAEFDRLQAADNYSEAYFFHGLAVQAAEATAVYVNRQVINAGLKIPPKQGKRYSWGYPACPDLHDHETLLRLLPAASSDLGMTLTESFQWIPEQSTAAIVAHHPDAQYFSVGIDRVQQIEEA